MTAEPLWSPAREAREAMLTRDWLYPPARNVLTAWTPGPPPRFVRGNDEAGVLVIETYLDNSRD